MLVLRRYFDFYKSSNNNSPFYIIIKIIPGSNNFKYDIFEIIFVANILLPE